MIDMDIMNTIYQYVIITFVFNTMLHHVGMLWIIKTHEQLQYYMDKQNSEWMIGGTWYNTYICKKLHSKVFEVFTRNARTDRYNITCSIDAHLKEHQSSCDDCICGGVVHYHQIQQQKYYICSVQPYILSVVR